MIELRNIGAFTKVATGGTWRLLTRFALDGKEGLIFHFLQGFWYRFLVDAKIYEIQKRARSENKNIRDVIEEFYGIR